MDFKYLVVGFVLVAIGIFIAVKEARKNQPKKDLKKIIDFSSALLGGTNYGLALLFIGGGFLFIFSGAGVFR